MELTIKLNEDDLRKGHVRDALRTLVHEMAGCEEQDWEDVEPTEAPEVAIEVEEAPEPEVKKRKPRTKKKEAAAPEMSEEEMRDVVRKFRNEHGAEKAIELLHRYAGLLTELKPEDRPKLKADMEAYQPEDDDPLGV